MSRQDAIREPVQERSQKRVELVLAAARKIIEAKEDTSMTMNEVAKEAGISVGSIYQYFPNKNAIVAAIAAQILDENTCKNTEILSVTPPSLMHLAHVTTHMLDEYYVLQMENPVLKYIWAAHIEDAELKEAGNADDVTNTDYIFEISKDLFEEKYHDKAKRALLITVKLGAAVVDLAVQFDRKEADQIMNDAKVMLYATWDAAVMPLGKERR